MKIIAKQVPPEYQESPLFREDWPENVYVFGNRHYNQHAGPLAAIRHGLEEIAEEWEDLTAGGRGYYESWKDALNDLFPARDDGREYNRVERLALARLAREYCECRSCEENNILCAALEIITGTEYAAGTIRGTCQGDWQEIIYPAECGREWLDEFETEYFNTGTEWNIDPDGDNYYFYAHGWNNELIRAEIAADAGVDPENVILYSFTGWRKTPEYEEASA